MSAPSLLGSKKKVVGQDDLQDIPHDFSSSMTGR